jgi:DNA-binding transcriptional regulator YiaG
MSPAEVVRVRGKVLRETQAQFAARLGVSRVTVARWETGTQSVSASMAKLIQLIAITGRKEERKRST